MAKQLRFGSRPHAKSKRPGNAPGSNGGVSSRAPVAKSGGTPESGWRRAYTVPALPDPALAIDFAVQLANFPFPGEPLARFDFLESQRDPTERQWKLWSHQVRRAIWSIRSSAAPKSEARGPKFATEPQDDNAWHEWAMDSLRIKAENTTRPITVEFARALSQWNARCDPESGQLELIPRTPFTLAAYAVALMADAEAGYFDSGGKFVPFASRLVVCGWVKCLRLIFNAPDAGAPQVFCCKAHKNAEHSRRSRKAKMMKVYHVTNREGARRIETHGFEHATVWVSDRPLFELGQACLELEMAADVLSGYELIGDGFGYREWIVPAKALNRAARRRVR